jgi:hypothetical protein
LYSLDKSHELISSSSHADNNSTNSMVEQNVIKSGSTTRKHCKMPVIAGLEADSVSKVIMK